jgi:hypothetical protein
MRATDPPAAAAAHFHRQKYLYGFAPVGEVVEYVRTNATAEEIDRLPEITAAWNAIRPDIDAVLASEAGLSESVKITDLPPEKAAEAAALVSGKLLQRGLNLRNAVALVEIDKLIAAQRRVNLNYVDQIAAGLPNEITLDFLLGFCLSPKREGAAIQHLDLGRNSHAFSSPSADLRFLGSFLKTLSPADIESAESGGLPVVAVISFIGYGDSPVNVLWSGSRAVLNNGFHRVYALRQRGVRTIPVILQFASNALLEFPSHLVDLPREYLLAHPRPVLMKDFFEEKFNTVLKVKNKLKTVTFRPKVQQHDVPC